MTLSGHITAANNLLIEEEEKKGSDEGSNELLLNNTFKSMSETDSLCTDSSMEGYQSTTSSDSSMEMDVSLILEHPILES